MGIMVELDSVAAAVLSEIPGAAVKYEIPVEPQSGQFIVRAQNSDLSSESLFTFRIERDYQIIFYSDDPQTAVETMDRLARRFMRGDTMIPLADNSLRYIRISGVGFGTPVLTESGLFSILGIMQTELRQARDQEAYTKIMGLNARLI